MAKIVTRPLEEDKAKRLRDYEGKKPYDYIITSPGNYVIVKEYAKYAEKLFNFEVRDDDIFILTWPKNGTTWAQELVWSLLNYENIDEAKTIALDKRSPYLECDMLIDLAVKDRDEIIMSTFEDTESPRIFKSHLPFCLLPPKVLNKCKVVSCLRNPKDTLVSFYYYTNLFRKDGSIGEFEVFFNLFLDSLLCYCPYWDSVLGYWEKRHHPKMCLLFYEDMKRDFAGSVREVAKFLQKDINDAVVDKLVARLSFKKLKEISQLQGKEGSIECIPQVYRKGEIGDWKNHFTDEMNERIDKVIAEKFKDTGLKFTYE